MLVSLLKFAIIKLTLCGFYTRDYFGKSIATGLNGPVNCIPHRYTIIIINQKAVNSLNVFN
jgi:hypothetical protein